MDVALYYCYACGSRLNRDETEASLSHGESFSTACCSACATAGKRIENPQQIEAAKIKLPRTSVSAENPIPDDSSEISAIREPINIPEVQSSTRINRSTTMLKRTPSAAVDRRNERAAPKSASLPILPIAIGAAVVLLGIVGFVMTRGGEKAANVDTTQKIAETKAPEPPAEPPVGRDTAEPAPLAETQPSQLAAAAARPVISGGILAPNDQYSTLTAESYIRYKNYAKARERLDSLEKSLPADEKFNEVRTKIGVVRDECQKASQAALDEVLKAAELKALAGDMAGLRLALGPQRTMDLLPEHVKAAEAEWEKFQGQSEALIKAAEERRQAARAEFESRIPTPEQLGAPRENVHVVFGPGTFKNISAGKETIQTPAGKVPYLDATKKVDFNSGAGSLYGSSIIFEYTSAEPLQCVISLNVKEAGWVSGTATLPPGEMKTEAVKLTKEFIIKAKRGDWAGRSIVDMKIDFKNAKPAATGIFRISFTK